MKKVVKESEVTNLETEIKFQEKNVERLRDQANWALNYGKIKLSDSLRQSMFHEEEVLRNLKLRLREEN